MQVNGDGAGYVAEAAAMIGAPLLHLSTDYVFDGALDRPYREDDPTGPTGAYGRSKLAGEKHVASPVQTAQYCARPGSTVRSARISSARCCASTRRARRSASWLTSGAIRPRPSTSPMRCSSSPSAFSGDPSPALRGVFHMTGSGEATWADFAEAVFDEAHARGRRFTRVRRIASAEYPTAARRPANSRLDNEKLRRVYGVALPNWRASARGVLRAAHRMIKETYDDCADVLVTGGAGFIGSAVCRHLVGAGVNVLNLDTLTYAGNLASLSTIDNAPNYRFAKIDICDRRAVAEVFETFRAGSCDPPRRREPRRPLDHRQRRLHPDEHHRHLLDAGGGASLLARTAAGKARRVPLPARFDRRGLRLAWRAKACSSRRRPTIRARPIPPRRRHPTISSRPGRAPTGSRPSSPTAPTITARIISPKS